MGGVLPQPLAARQGRAQHPRRQLHRRLLLERLRQGRHRHLGDAGDRLSAAGGGPAALRAARLPAGHLLLLVPLQPAAGEVPLHPRRAARPVARGQKRHTPIRWRPGPPSWRTRRTRAATSRPAARAASAAPPGTRSLEIIAASSLYTAKKCGPDRVVGFSPIPAMSYAQLRRRLALPPALRRREPELLRLVRRPAQRLPGDLGRADRRVRERRLVQLQVHRRRWAPT